MTYDPSVIRARLQIRKSEREYEVGMREMGTLGNSCISQNIGLFPYIVSFRVGLT